MRDALKFDHGSPPASIETSFSVPRCSPLPSRTDPPAYCRALECGTRNAMEMLIFTGSVI